MRKSWKEWLRKGVEAAKYQVATTWWLLEAYADAVATELVLGLACWLEKRVERKIKAECRKHPEKFGYFDLW